jgi:glycosyltransferase involved in cell wall biosynthesis
LPDLMPWLEMHVDRFDLVVFSGYMFPTTTLGLPHIAGSVPTVVQPVVHDEPALRLPTVRPLFEHAAGICALTDEEAQLIQRRFRPPGVMRVVGGGVEHAPAVDRPELDAIEERLGIRAGRFIISVGRIEEGKGTPELVDYFEEYVNRRDSDLQLVLVGANAANLRRKRNVIFADFVPEHVKWGLLADAELLVQPSYFESFSLSLVEGWRQGLPALVQGRCDVLAGQVRRSGGGLTYRNFAEFDTTLDVLISSEGLRHDLGQAGHDYARRYDWGTVIDGFEGLADEAIGRWNITDGPRSRVHRFQGAAT